VSAEPVLVFGATGSQGGAVARELLSRAVPVRALVRDSASERARALSDLGAELVVGDLTDEWSLAQAFSTVPVAYAITTPFENGADAEVRQGDTIIRAAAQAGLPWLILASVAAADRAPVPHFRSKARIEAQLGAGSVPWTVVAPSYFYENVLGASLAEGVLPLPLPVHTPLDQGDLLQGLGQRVSRSCSAMAGRCRPTTGTPRCCSSSARLSRHRPRPPRPRPLHPDRRRPRHGSLRRRPRGGDRASRSERTPSTSATPPAAARSCTTSPGTARAGWRRRC
jgi:hypothetical protein